MSNYENMTKAELIEFINANKSGGRKQQVLDLLNQGYDTIEAISEKIQISTKNVSSQLTYLRNDGHIIITLNINKQSILMMLNEEQLTYLQSLKK